ncbi:hypothetical protein EIP86_000971 [Pleurotus ostreatoroseus]|nr:hypothetical protein EIP86_000971 [Pleurotus ostreatoroseus]
MPRPLQLYFTGSSTATCGLASLSLEIIYMIIRYFGTIDLLVWGHLSRACHRQAVGEWQHRFCVLLEPFMRDVHEFQASITRLRACVAGPVALALLDWGNFSVARATLDIYVPVSKAYRMQLFLTRSEHYHLRRKIQLTYGENENLHLDTCYEFERESKIIRVRSVRAESFFGAVPAAWCTILMNAVTPAGIYCAYPAATLGGRGVINGHYLDFDGMPDGVLPKLLTRYRERGYDIRCNHLAWMAESHPQASCPGGGNQLGGELCPRFPRHSRDKYSLYVPFTSFAEAHRREAMRRADPDNVESVVWQLGGVDYQNEINLFVFYTCEMRAINNLVL